MVAGVIPAERFDLQFLLLGDPSDQTNARALVGQQTSAHMVGVGSGFRLSGFSLLVNGIVETGGPEQFRVNELVRRRCGGHLACFSAFSVRDCNHVLPQ